MPVDRGVIDAQLRDIGEGERWWEMREFRDLPHVLHPDEKITGITTGKLLGIRRPRLRSPVWLFVVTNERLICLQQQRFARKQVEVVAGQMTAVKQGPGFRSYQIAIRTPQRRYRLRIPKGEAFRFLAALGPLTPQKPSPLHPDLEPLSWIPGIETVVALPGVSGLVTRVSMLSPPDRAANDLAELRITVERLQGDVERLQQHVSFLEELLEKRAEETFLPSTSSAND